MYFRQDVSDLLGRVSFLEIKVVSRPTLCTFKKKDAVEAYIWASLYEEYEKFLSTLGVCE